MKRIAILASGTGTNAERIIRHLAGNSEVQVTLVLSNNPDAAVLQKAECLGVQTKVFTKAELNITGEVLHLLKDNHIDLIVLAGFLLLIPDELVQAYSNRIINIHPALLPKHGGKGMYGMHVHRAVKTCGDTTSGITIHLVNAEYDKGEILFQASCDVLPTDTPETIAAKVQDLERQHFPKVVLDFALAG